MEKADDSRRTKKISSKNRVRNLAKETNENGISIKTSKDANKKTSNVKEKMTRYQKTKQTPFIVSFITILGGFLWILKKNKQNASNFIVKNRPIDNLFMGKNTKKQGKLTLKSIENGLKSTKKTSSLLFYKKM